jgi:hypothetical protein
VKSKKWTVIAKPDDIFFVKLPTASKLDHYALHPALYRNIKNLDTLDDFASLIGVQSNWREIYNAKVCGNSFVELVLKTYAQLPDDSSEDNIENTIILLVNSVAISLMKQIYAWKSKVIVGGMLAESQYDILSATDTFFTVDGVKVLSTEMKTAKTFLPHKHWYHESRGVQSFCALFGHGCPMFLCNQKIWKLFVENRERNQIYTFPFGSTQGTKLAKSNVMSRFDEDGGSDFLMAITICLLKTVELNVESVVKEAASVSIQEPAKEVQETINIDHLRAVVPNNESTTVDTPASRVVKPRFATGHDKDGLPIYRTLRVYSAEETERILL